MNREVIATGRTVEEALEKAYEQMGLSPEDAQFEIVDLPKKGFLGLGNTPAKVRVYVEEQNQSKAQCAAEYLSGIFAHMNLGEITMNTEETENGAKITVDGEGLGVLIGRRGETLDALQYLAGLVANRLEGDYFRVVVDSGDYREKRKKTLEKLAKTLSSQALRTGRNVTLEPMNPYERRIIHSAIQEIEGVKSSSVGEEPYRKVVIAPLNPRRGGGDRDRDRRSGSGNRGGKPPYGARSGDRRPPRDAQPAQAAPSTAPAQPRPKLEEEEISKPLYSKIDLD